MSSLHPEHLGSFALGCVVPDWRSFSKVAFTLIQRQFLALQVDQDTELGRDANHGLGHHFSADLSTGRTSNPL